MRAWSTLGVAVIPVAAFLTLPAVLIVPMSFSSGSTFQSPPPGLSTRWYENLFTVWDGVWARGQLTPRERSLLTIAILAALGRPDESAMHVGAAEVNGCSVDDVREVLLHVAPYGGTPVALSAFRVAERVPATPDGHEQAGAGDG